MAEIKEIIEAQRIYFGTGVTREPDFRIDGLKRLKSAIGEYEERIYAALCEDLHKSPYETYLTEIGMVLQELRTHIRHLRKWAKPRRVPTPIHLPGGRSRIVCEPLGVVLVIAPWNYPFQLLINPLIGALSAGNCVVLKPSPNVPRTSEVMAEMIRSVFDARQVAVVEGGREANTALLAERFDYIFFTGSPALGKVVMQAAAAYLTPVTLELGGKSPCIVDETANLDAAARRIAWGKCLNAGQTCVAPDYLFVHSSVKSALLDKIDRSICRFFGDNPLDSPDYPRIVNVEAVERIRKLMQCGLIYRGGEVDEEQRYVAPTILTEVSPDDPVMQEEIFGPVLPVLEFTKRSEVIDYINRHEKPLALYYFGNRRGADEVIARTSSGGVCVNDTIMHIASHYLPFGGVGNSGMGKYHGYDSFVTFSNRRAVLYSPVLWDIPFKYPPYRCLSLLKKMIR